VIGEVLTRQQRGEKHQREHCECARAAHSASLSSDSVSSRGSATSARSTLGHCE
jgi:hypothetical protein